MSYPNAFIWYATWLYYSNWIVLSPTPEYGRFRKTAIESATYANPTGFFAWMVTIVYLKLMQKRSKIEGGVLCFFNHLCKTHFRPCGRRFLKFSTFWKIRWFFGALEILWCKNYFDTIFLCRVMISERLGEKEGEKNKKSLNPLFRGPKFKIGEKNGSRCLGRPKILPL